MIAFLKNLSIFKDEKAQAMVEFMIVFPIVLILTCGAFEFSMLSLIHQNVNYASFCGARAETVEKDARFSVILRLCAAVPDAIESLSPTDAIEIVMGGSGAHSDTDYMQMDDFYSWFDKILEEILPSSLFYTILTTLGGLVDDDGSTAGIPASVKGFNFLLTNVPDTVIQIYNTIASKNISLDIFKDSYDTITSNPGDPFDEYFYKQLKIIRKVLYALLLTDVEVTEDTSNDNAPALKVTVTYYYNLKFPVIRSLFKYVLKTIDPDSKNAFSGSGQKWEKADAFSLISNTVFIPITHSTLIGDERNMA